MNRVCRVDAGGVHKNYFFPVEVVAVVDLPDELDPADRFEGRFHFFLD